MKQKQLCTIRNVGLAELSFHIKNTGSRDLKLASMIFVAKVRFLKFEYANAEWFTFKGGQHLMQLKILKL